MGGLKKLIAMRLTHEIGIYTCSKQLIELKETFAKTSVRKYLASNPKFYIEAFKAIADEVDITERFDRAPDPDDNYLFDLAYTVKSHFIITNDKPILNMKQVNKIKLISMAQLREILSKSF